MNNSGRRKQLHSSIGLRVPVFLLDLKGYDFESFE
jgi:hypothetical protein